MPIYEFDCTACGHTFERLQKLSDADPTQCPECGRDTVKRRLSAPAFRLAGSGWYETDFKGDKDKKRNLAGESAGKAEGAAETKSTPAEKAASAGETKPAAPAPAATTTSPAS